MEWVSIDYRGWAIHWHRHEHRMYMKKGGLFGASHHFREHPRDRATAFAIAKAWIDDRR